MVTLVIKWLFLILLVLDKVDALILVVIEWWIEKDVDYISLLHMLLFNCLGLVHLSSFNLSYTLMFKLNV